MKMPSQIALHFASTVTLFLSYSANDLLAADGQQQAVQRVDFARKILPILSDKCFVCHGPDAKDDDLVRLDSLEGATSDRGGYRAIDPADLEKSEILVRVHSADEPMPPAEVEKQLTPKERELISQWVRQGGEYALHWAFVPPRKQQVDGKDLHPRHAIDGFIEAGLEERGVAFSPEADRATLARRVALVLTGLPSELDQLQAFLQDESDGAYERLVDQLLASSRYGEHQARYWLDAVRYGDTHGLHLDNRRGIYPYRDWVVQALNDNLPLDDFITWQLAGDLLPNPTGAQRVATGYVRMNPSTAEGGAIPAEFQAKNNFDRTETLGTVLLGMSLTCARCHTHKYDPIPQKEYYRLLAFFNSTAEHSMDGNAYVYGPIVKAPRYQATWKEWNQIEADREQLLSQAEIEAEKLQEAIHKYAAASSLWTATRWRLSQPVDVSAPAPADEQWSDVKGLPGTGKQKMPDATKAVWVAFELNSPIEQTLWLTFSGGANSKLFLDSEQVKRFDDGTLQQQPMALSPGSHQVRLKMVGVPGGPSIETKLVSYWKAAAAACWDTGDARDRLLMLADPYGPLAVLKLQDRVCELVQSIDAATARFTTSLVAHDLETPRTTKILQRGEYNLPIGEALEPGILTVMSGFPQGAPRNRLGLARWLTSRDHPLVSRVLVNRIWQRTFAEGIVRTPEDFGSQGEQPTHPALLDWLAVELQESGWNLKHTLRMMVTSRTFRQSSAWQDTVDDPENRLFARGPSHRLDAEVIRDVALWASDLLDPHMGGEGVKPYQPSGMWLAMAHPVSNTKQYVRDKGQLLYRRSLYVYWKRTSPHPMMTLFDAPNRESSCVKRSRTNTSLQSLGLLNETQRVEMSRMLAERLLKQAQDDESRLNLLFTLLACRNPTEVERSACSKLLQTMRDRYSDAAQDAEALLAVGEAVRDKQLNLVEHAAWTQVAVTVLASDIALLLY